MSRYSDDGMSLFIPDNLAPPVAQDYSTPPTQTPVPVPAAAQTPAPLLDVEGDGQYLRTSDQEREEVAREVRYENKFAVASLIEKLDEAERYRDLGKLINLSERFGSLMWGWDPLLGVKVHRIAIRLFYLHNNIHRLRDLRPLAPGEPVPEHIREIKELIRLAEEYEETYLKGDPEQSEELYRTAVHLLRRHIALHNARRHLAPMLGDPPPRQVENAPATAVPQSLPPTYNRPPGSS